MHTRGRRARAPALACVLTALVAGACDTSFEPIAESDVRFSVFGYLDASADTQWIRVMPIRPLATTSPDSFGITVTLEELGTGRVIPLRDSLFSFAHHADADVGSAGTYVHDFWTTEPIERGTTYRFSATREGEAPAEAVVEVPDDYAVEVWLDQRYFGNADQLRVVGLKYLPFLTALTYFVDRCGSGVDSVRYEARSREGEMAAIPLPRAAVPPRGTCGAPTIQGRTLWIVGSASSWPSGTEYSPWGLGVPDRASNVTNAVGFLAGVLTKVVPRESCVFDDGGAPVPDYCVLRYDAASASVRGTVRESRCGDGAMEFVTVEVREIVDPPTASRVRTVVTGPSGAFDIGALEPGVRYSLKARARPAPIYGEGEIDLYAMHHDTLTFAPGQHPIYDIGLDRLTPCDQKP